MVLGLVVMCAPAVAVAGPAVLHIHRVFVIAELISHRTASISMNFKYLFSRTHKRSLINFKLSLSQYPHIPFKTWESKDPNALQVNPEGRKTSYLSQKDELDFRIRKKQLANAQIYHFNKKFDGSRAVKE